MGLGRGGEGFKLKAAELCDNILFNKCLPIQRCTAAYNSNFVHECLIKKSLSRDRFTADRALACLGPRCIENCIFLLFIFRCSQSVRLKSFIKLLKCANKVLFGLLCDAFRELVRWRCWRAH